MAHLPMSEATVVDRNAGDGAAGGVGGELHIRGRPEAAIAHFHHPRLGIGGGSPRLLLCLRLWRYRLCLVRLGEGGFPGLPFGTLTRLLLLLRLQRFGDRQRLLDAPRTVVRRPMARRHLSPAGRARVLLEFGAQRRTRSSASCRQTSERAVPAERRRPGSGTHPHAILGDAIQLRRADPQQRGEAVGQQLLQRRAMRHRKSASVLAFMPTPPHSPLEGDMLLAQPRQFASTADPLHGCIQPQRQQDARVGRRMPGLTLHRLDRAAQRCKVQPFDEAPDQAHPMFVRNKGLEVHGTKRHLPPVCRAKPRKCNARPLRRRLDRQSFDQRRTIFLRHSDNTMRFPMPILANPIPVDLRNPPARRNIFRL